MSKIGTNIRAFCIAAITITLVADLLGFIAFIFLDNTLASTNIITYRNAEIIRTQETKDGRLVYGKHGNNVLFAKAEKKKYENGDKVDFVETDTITYFTKHIVDKSFSIK